MLDDFVRYSSTLVPQDERRWFRQVAIIDRLCVFVDARCYNLESVASELFKTISHVRMPLVVEPFIRSARRTRRKFWEALDIIKQVYVQYTDGIARTKNGIHIMRIVNIFENDRKRRLT